MSRILDVYLHEKMAGTLAQNENGQLVFKYNSNYLDSNGMAISVSMPLRDEPYPDRIARPYFAGLLPDERARRRLAAVLGVSDENVFGLLEIIGGECAGALSLLPQGQPLPDFSTGTVEVLDGKRLAELLDLLRQKPLLGGVEGIRLSLAGAQDKLAVCFIDGQIFLPKNGLPTTHILKPFIEGLSGTVENEVFCMMLAGRVGLDAPVVSKGMAGNTGFILVERYDRVREENGRILRLHQEDFCQALGVPPEIKYESEGGPGIASSQALIQNVTQRPAADRRAFQQRVIFHYLVGNADAHAKNYSLLYQGKTPVLAPVYDVVCTDVYSLAKNMAMKIGERSLPDTIRLEDWQKMVPDTRVAKRILSDDLLRMANGIEIEADRLLEELNDQNIYHPVLKKIRRTIGVRVRTIQKLMEKIA